MAFEKQHKFLRGHKAKGEGLIFEGHASLFEVIFESMCLFFNLVNSALGMNPHPNTIESYLIHVKQFSLDKSAAACKGKTDLVRLQKESPLGL